VLADDPKADREAQPRPLADFLGGVERLEEMLAHLGRQPGAVIAHPHLHHPTHQARRDGDIAPRAGALDGIVGVVDQVQQHLLHLAGIGQHA